jgi:hypothetical protein
MDLTSFLIGMSVLPIFGVAWYLAWRLKNFITRRIESPEIADAKTRARLAARIYGSRKVFVARFAQATFAVTLGRAYGHQQRADMALSALGDEHRGQRAGSVR